MTHIEAGGIPKADRIQRLMIGGGLMLLTLTGLLERVEWRALVALSFQTELLLTGIAGWCPIYWTCRIAAKKQ
jgi:hypothetical protein